MRQEYFVAVKLEPWRQTLKSERERNRILIHADCVIVHYCASNWFQEAIEGIDWHARELQVKLNCWRVVCVPANISAKVTQFHSPDHWCYSWLDSVCHVSKAMEGAWDTEVNQNWITGWHKLWKTRISIKETKLFSAVWSCFWRKNPIVFPKLTDISH